MDDEKRTFGDYVLITSIWIGEYEIGICENPKAEKKDERFLCGYIENNGVWEYIKDNMVGESYADIVTCYGERIAEKAEEFQMETERILKEVGDNSPVSIEDCIPVTQDDDISGKVIVLKPDVFRPEYRRATSQLMLCTGGFGSQRNSRGRTCFCTRLYDNENKQFYRSEVLGIMPEDKLPEWAKRGLEAARRQDKKKDTRGDR